MRNLRLVLPWALAASATAVLLAAAARHRPAPSEALLASPVLRDERASGDPRPPAPSSAPAPPEDAPGDEDSESFESSRVTCDDGVAAVRRGLSRTDDGLANREVLRLCTLTQIAASRGADCAARVRDQLASAPACGRAYGAVAACVVSSPYFAAEWTRTLFAGASTACRAKLVPSLHQARHVDLQLVTAVAPFARAQTKEGPRSRAFLALGSLERTARAETPQAVDAVAYVDALLARELHGTTGLRRQVMLEAAGNAACAGCLDDVRTSLRAEDPILRRSATAALRFYEGPSELEALCRAASDDSSELVREQAVWSLRWSPSNEAPRALCLEQAARGDATESVRMAAVQSLLALSGASPRAVVALENLSRGKVERAELLVAASDPDRGIFDPFGRGDEP
jgi:hypothetical protein